VKTLLVEDDPVLGQALAAMLGRGGLGVEWVRDGIDAYLAWQRGGHSAVVLDLGLPGLDGWNLLGRIRSSGGKVPVLIITGRVEVEDRIRCLDLGADDYVTKPFDVDELLARLRAVTRRFDVVPGAGVAVGSVEINLHRQCVTRDGLPVWLTRREYAVLEMLLTSVGRAVSRQSIAEHLGAPSAETVGNLIDVYIHTLRKKLGRDLIHTYRGGYCIPG